MPYEITSFQQKKLNERGSLYVYGDDNHVGETVYVSHSYREDGATTIIWRNVYDMTHQYIAGYAPENCLEAL